jgi:hypothetical protein
VAEALAHSSRGNAALIEAASKVLRKLISSPWDEIWSGTGACEQVAEADTKPVHTEKSKKSMK